MHIFTSTFAARACHYASITSMWVDVRDSGVCFYYANSDQIVDLNQNDASKIAHRLGKTAPIPIDV